MTLILTPIEALDDFRGVSVPKDTNFRHLVISGPPGSGKTMLVEKLRGWPEEGYLDLAANNWWRSALLTFRPREVHFGFPFEGFRDSHAVFDREWLENRTPLQLARILLPPRKSGFLTRDWRSRYVFDFLIPPAGQILAARQRRFRQGSHPMDEMLTLEQVCAQCQVYEMLALHFHQHDMKVFVRAAFGGPPQRVVSPSPQS